jgi:hypothetical protein
VAEAPVHLPPLSEAEAEGAEAEEALREKDHQLLELRSNEANRPRAAAGGIEVEANSTRD